MRSKALDIEYTNRVLLILAFVLALLVFMDFQARRHYQSQLGFDTDSLKTDAIEEAQARTRQAADLLQKPIRATADSILGYSRKIIAEGKVGEKIRSHKRRSRNKIKEIVEHNLENSGESGLQAWIEPTPQFIFLYYIRFRQGRSEMVRVRRRINSPRLSYIDVLRLLQKGPQLREHGLINTFGKRIKIYGIYLEKNRLIVDLGKEVEAMGRHVIRDRLDQLVLTLTQFSKYKKIELWIDGRPVRSLGRSKLPLPRVLFIPKRKVKDYIE